MQSRRINSSFWRGKRVFLTGHTGFKGTWMTLLLASLGAKTTGYSLPAPTSPNMYELVGADKYINSIIADIRDFDKLKQELARAEPDIVIHMAAQPLVRLSYEQPLETFSTNIMGTAHVLEAVRAARCCKAALIVTSDKCYRNNEWYWGYREDEAMGGHDPYSASKGCAELLTAALRDSFFSQAGTCAVASARAGNVIGGGDWAQDRLIPDIIRAIENNSTVHIRRPDSIRPWQFVLEPVSAYLMLCEDLVTHGKNHAQAWNFGPNSSDEQPVQNLISEFSRLWGQDFKWQLDVAKENPHEAGYLRLDCSKAKHKLGYTPRWDLAKALQESVAWYKTYFQNKAKLHDLSLAQIEAFGAA